MSGFSIPSKKAPYPQNRETVSKKREDVPVELESQFIMRLPENIAKEIRAVVKSGALNLKDRFRIKLELDNRHGEVMFDDHVLDAAVGDLPAILESHKSLDSKTFYKTADICQMMICTEKGENKKPEEDEPLKKKDKKDDKKDKKHQLPHGITPPLKNVRKRRFRKTLKKKYADAPETEKEVKRLLRIDNEAKSIRYEIVTGDEDISKTDVSGEKNELSNNEIMETSVDNENIVEISEPIVNLDANSQSVAIEHDIFGEVLSDSDNDEVNIIDSADDETSRFSTGIGLPEDEDSGLKQGDKEDGLITEFSRSMLDSPSVESGLEIFGEDSMMSNEANSPSKQDNRDSGIMNRIEDLEQDINQIKSRKQEQQDQIAQIKNQDLKDRLKDGLEELKREEAEKQEEYAQLISLLAQS